MGLWTEFINWVNGLAPADLLALTSLSAAVCGGVVSGIVGWIQTHNTNKLAKDANEVSKTANEISNKALQTASDQVEYHWIITYDTERWCVHVVNDAPCLAHDCIILFRWDGISLSELKLSDVPEFGVYEHEFRLPHESDIHKLSVYVMWTSELGVRHSVRKDLYVPHDPDSPNGSYTIDEHGNKILDIIDFFVERGGARK